MTKADIVNEIAKKTGAEKVLVQQIVEAFMDSVRARSSRRRTYI